MAICKLCQNNTTLCNSHIIPEFAYKDVYVFPTSNNRRIQTLRFEKGAEQQLTNEQKGIREYLLCSDCEGKLSEWEKYTVEVLREKFSTYESGFIYADVEYSKVRLFQLSILWRCSITSNEDFQFKLGHQHSETLRLMLLNSDLGDYWQYPCITSLLLSENSIRKDIIMTDEGNEVDGLEE